MVSRIGKVGGGTEYGVVGVKRRIGRQQAAVLLKFLSNCTIGFLKKSPIDAEQPKGGAATVRASRVPPRVVSGSGAGREELALARQSERTGALQMIAGTRIG